MTVLTDSAAVAALCSRLAAAPYVAIDTEFMRDNSYWPKLCLVQLAVPGEAAAIDPLAAGIDLAPLWQLMAAPVLKVFHAARQDIEVFVHRSGRVPAPLFDTQIAAMVCGFGEAASYETLAARLARAQIDKSARFTDWSRRPLSERQIAYALSDVTHLCVVYERLAEMLGQSGRADWVGEELAALVDPALYRADPAEAWKRLRVRGGNPRMLGVLAAIAAWREREAQARDLPRGRLIKDEALIEIAAHPPRVTDDLRSVRLLPRGFSESRLAEPLLAAVKAGLAAPAPAVERNGRRTNGAELGPLVDLLKVLLKAKCEAEGVAPRLVADAEDLEALAAEDAPDLPALHGWRRALFGDDALALKAGRLSLAAEGRRVKLIRL
ncbi:MAG: ribonuclease D [Alphaproteobacteria bacterium]|nr:ribonuclease D [Alphaproteobacteria bacterium]